MERATLRDIAEAAGTSVSTVSRALRGSSRISERTRARVGAVAAELGYRADLAGSLLRTSNPRIIGLLCRLEQELHFTYHEHILEFAEELGFRVVVESVGESRNPLDALGSFQQFRCQAVIAVDPSSLAGLNDAIAGVPMVVIGQQRPLGSMDLVTSDNTEGMREVAQHLRSLGHRDVAYVDGPAGVSAECRRLAFEPAAQEAELLTRIVAGGADVDSGYHAMGAVLAQGDLPLPTAVVCYNDQCAQGVMVRLLQEGIAPGREVSVVGFDNSRVAAAETFSITSVDRGASQVARHAVDLAVARATGDNGLPQTIRVGTALVRRNSTGPAPVSID